MKLFKNKVGRPTNEIKFIRKIFIVSTITILMSVISLTISCILLIGKIENKMLGSLDRVKNKNSIKIQIGPLNGGKSKEFSSKVFGKLFSIDYYTWKIADEKDSKGRSFGKKYVDYKIKNNGSKSVWYGWFTYSKSDIKNNLNYGKTASERGCVEIKPEKSAEDDELKSLNVYTSGDSSTRIGKIKVYESKNACKADNDGTAEALNELTIKYKYSSGTENNSSKEDAGVVAMLKALIEWIINLFEKKDTPSNGDKQDIPPTSRDDEYVTGKLGYPLEQSIYKKASVNNTNCFPNYCNGGTHGAIDVSCAIGDNVYAMDGGKVTLVSMYPYNCYGSCPKGNNQSFGNYVVITHKKDSCTGKNCTYETAYAHLSSVSVSNGSLIKKGYIIGKCGNTGNSSGPHLHFELRNMDLYKLYGRNQAKKSDRMGLMNAGKFVENGVTYYGLEYYGQK